MFLESTVLDLLSFAYNIYFFMIIAYILMSWLPNARESTVGLYLAKFVEPYLSIFRRFIPPIGGVIDLSPLAAIFVLQFIWLGIKTIVLFVL